MMVTYPFKKVSLPLANPNVHSNSVITHVLTYILKRFIQNFTQIQLNIIKKNYNYVS